jgi:mannose-1-phosphate guanylyltransferase
MTVESWITSRRHVRAAAAANHLWGIVLAGTPGARHVRQRSGGGAVGARRDTALRHTLDRAAGLIPAERLVAVLPRDHAPTYETALTALPAVKRVLQPAYRGSAAEVFHPLLRITQDDPEAIAAILPTDSRGDYEGAFMTYVARAAQAVSARPELPMVIGAQPASPTPGRPWIEPGLVVEGLEDLNVRTVRRFIAQPTAAELCALYEGEGLLNTHVIVAKARTLIALGERYLPDVLETLEPLERAFGAPEERLMTEAVYEGMPFASVEHALFAPPGAFAVLPAARAAWRDATRPALAHALAS